MPIEVTGLEELVVKLRATGRGIVDAIEQEMAAVTIGLQADIVSEKLEGQVLKSHTHHLARSIIQSVTREGDVIVGTVGVAQEAWYGALHEFGGTFDVPEHQRVSKRGKSFIVRAHTITFPERSFVRSTVREHESAIVAQLQGAANKALP